MAQAHPLPEVYVETPTYEEDMVQLVTIKSEYADDIGRPMFSHENPMDHSNYRVQDLSNMQVRPHGGMPYLPEYHNKPGSSVDFRNTNWRVAPFYRCKNKTFLAEHNRTEFIQPNMPVVNENDIGFQIKLENKDLLEKNLEELSEFHLQLLEDAAILKEEESKLNIGLNRRKSEEQLAVQRERNRLRKKHQRMMQTVEEYNREKERNRLRKRELRRNMSPTRLAIERERGRLRKRQLRMMMSEERLTKEKEKDKLRKQLKRRNMTQNIGTVVKEETVTTTPQCQECRASNEESAYQLVTSIVATVYNQTSATSS